MVYRAFPLLFSLLAAALFAVPTSAGTVNILEQSAKIRPQALATEQASEHTSKVSTVRSSSLPTLGRRANIAAVKMRANGASSQASYSGTRKVLSNIHRKISSKSVVIMDTKTGEILFSKSADNPRQPASTIKVITGLIAIQSLKDEDPVQVSHRAAGMPRSKIYVDPKKVYKADDMINAVLLASANDASVAVAETIAGSEQAFADIMTQKARSWGATKTVCRTASGLTAKGQYSTARDLAVIFRHAMQNEEFASRMKHRKIKTSYGKTLYNHNKALWRVDGTLAGKTGYTAAARQTYVGQFSRGDDTITVAIMGSETMWSDVKNLVNYGFKKKEQITLARASKSEDDAVSIN